MRLLRPLFEVMAVFLHRAIVAQLQGERDPVLPHDPASRVHYLMKSATEQRQQDAVYAFQLKFRRGRRLFFALQTRPQCLL